MAPSSSPGSHCAELSGQCCSLLRPESCSPCTTSKQRRQLLFSVKSRPWHSCLLGCIHWSFLGPSQHEYFILLQWTRWLSEDGDICALLLHTGKEDGVLISSNPMQIRSLTWTAHSPQAVREGDVTRSPVFLLVGPSLGCSKMSS
jgi:hypothetical protein